MKSQETKKWNISAMGVGVECVFKTSTNLIVAIVVSKSQQNCIKIKKVRAIRSCQTPIMQDFFL